MMKRCKVKKDEKTGRFLKNGQSRKKGLNRSIADASWGELILKIEYLAVKSGKVVIKVNPKYSSQECRGCGHIDKFNRTGEKFICTQCGYMEHADIGAAKTIRDRCLFLSTWGLRETCCLTAKRHERYQHALLLQTC
jgi:putative transposase